MDNRYFGYIETKKTTGKKKVQQILDEKNNLSQEQLLKYPEAENMTQGEFVSFLIKKGYKAFEENIDTNTLTYKVKKLKKSYYMYNENENLKFWEC